MNNIRLGNLDDFETCKEIADNFDESTPTIKIFQKLCQNESLYILEKSGIIAWFISYQILWNNSMFLQFLRVSPKFQRQWVGKALMQHMEQVAVSQKVDELISTILVDNIASEWLHIQQGFIKSGSMNFTEAQEIVMIKELWNTK